MKFDFKKSVLATVTLLLGLFCLVALSHALPTDNASAFVQELIAQSRGRRSFGGAEGNGYYENLMNGKSSSTSLWIEKITLSKSTQTEVHEGDLYWYRGFLLYDVKPNLNLPNTVEGSVKTNSYGFFDSEHTLEKPSGTRRIALFGDSITRGWGMHLDQRYGNLFEHELNDRNKENFQVLNFAVPGYLLTQTFDVAQEKASAFHPDVYLVAMTELTGGLSWGDHIIKLVNNGQDLKYDLLRKVAQESGLQKGDSVELGRAKLVPYRELTLRELLLQIKMFAEQRSAKLIVAFVPGAEDQDVLDCAYQRLLESTKDTDIPVIDLSDTFHGKNIETLRRSWHDVHPTAAGHQLIAENLYKKLQQNPEAWADITGIPVTPKYLAGMNQQR